MRIVSYELRRCSSNVRRASGRERHPDSEFSRNISAMGLLVAFGLVSFLIFSERGGSCGADL